MSWFFVGVCTMGACALLIGFGWQAFVAAILLNMALALAAGENDE